MNRIIASIKAWFSNLRLRTQFIILTLFIFIITVSSSCYVYIQISSKNVMGKMSDVSIQSLTTISDNINKEIKNASNLSTIFLANSIIQEALHKPEASSDFSQWNRISSFIGSFRNGIPAASSVYIYDNYGNSYYTDPYEQKKLTSRSITSAPWYQTAFRENGKYILRLNADGAYGAAPHSFVSLIRVVQDLDTMQPIGILVLNIDQKTIMDCYSNVMENTNVNIALLDEHDRPITPYRSDSNIELESLVAKADSSKGTIFTKVKNTNYLISYLKMENTGWKLFSIMTLANNNRLDTSIIIPVIIIIVNGFLLVIGSILLVQFVTNPLNKLGRAMKRVENHEFGIVDLHVGNNEIGYLLGCYNIMIMEIDHLIKEIVREQNQKRELDLSLLQAQFTPHFLYNSIDIVRSMILTGNTKEANHMLKAIGGYYRIVLSKGKKLITVEEELKMIEHYLAIQDVHHGDLVRVKFDIDTEANPLLILKFVLQPLVENAVKHGILRLGEPGEIRVATHIRGDRLFLSVEDNGVGMTEAVLADIIASSGEVFQNSFGLRGTIERLRLFYGYDDVVAVESHIGVGTKVTIQVPVYSAGMVPEGEFSG